MTFAMPALRTVVWRPLDATGAEHCTLRKLAKGFRLEGHVITTVGSPLSSSVGATAGNPAANVPLHVH